MNSSTAQRRGAAGSSAAGRTVLVLAAGRLVERRPRAGDRLLARVRAGTLDQALADGLSPDRDRLRAVRAGMLVAPAARRELADAWADLLDRASRPYPPFDYRVPVPRGGILAASAEIRELASGLRAARPVSARGVALARVLLTDGRGPVYRPRDRGDLPAALRSALRHLD